MTWTDGFKKRMRDLGELSLEQLFPGGPGAWIVRKIGRWLLEQTTTESAWVYQTAQGVTASGGPGLVVGGSITQVWLKRDNEVVRLTCVLGGAGIALAPPLTVELADSGFPSRGILRISNGNKDFAALDDFMLPGFGAVGPCVLLVFDEKIFVGYQAAVLLLGVREALEKSLRNLSRHVEEALTIMREDPPKGFWRRSWDTFTRPLRIGYSNAKAFADIVEIIIEIVDTPPLNQFRGALFMEGAELSLAFPSVCGIGLGLVGYEGVVRASHDPVPESLLNIVERKMFGT